MLVKLSLSLSQLLPSHGVAILVDLQLSMPPGLLWTPGRRLHMMRRWGGSPYSKTSMLRFLAFFLISCGYNLFFGWGGVCFSWKLYSPQRCTMLLEPSPPIRIGWLSSVECHRFGSERATETEIESSMSPKINTGIAPEALLVNV